MSKIIDLEEYRRKKFLKEKSVKPEDISNEELFSILMGVMSQPIDQIDEIEKEAEKQARDDFEKYRDDEGSCRCLFCGSVLSEKGKDENEN